MDYDVFYKQNETHTKASHEEQKQNRQVTEHRFFGSDSHFISTHVWQKILTVCSISLLMSVMLHIKATNKASFNTKTKA